VAPIALGYERRLLAALGPEAHAALDGFLEALTARAEALATHDADQAAKMASRPARPRRKGR
jgi:hypothetical protein